MKTKITTQEVIEKITDPNTPDYQIMGWWNFCNTPKELPLSVFSLTDEVGMVIVRIHKERSREECEKMKEQARTCRFHDTYEWSQTDS